MDNNNNNNEYIPYKLQVIRKCYPSLEPKNSIGVYQFTKSNFTNKLFDTSLCKFSNK